MRWLACVFSVMLISCALPKATERTVTVIGHDFREYREKGFLVTPEQYLGDYESVGMINVFVSPAVKRFDPSVDDTKWEKFMVRGTAWLVERLDSKASIDEAVAAATKMGGDALVRFSVVRTFEFNGELMIPYYIVSGFAIKRK